jgi:hypothetical protein
VTGTKFYQNTFTASNLVGTEIADPVLFQGGSCPTNRQCRWSDAAVIEHANANSTWDIRKIHKTLSRGTTGFTIEQITIDSANPLFTIVGEKSSPSPITLLNKMGRTTGWTGKSYSFLCADINVVDQFNQDTGITLLCQDGVKARADAGDSGSPVFSRRSSTSTEAFLYGIVWGGSPTEFAYSAMVNIEFELGDLITQ